LPPLRSAHLPHSALSARELARWLVGAGFAECHNALLFPTKLGLEVGGALTAE
jgi:hypothetical protein